MTGCVIDKNDVKKYMKKLSTIESMEEGNEDECKEFVSLGDSVEEYNKKDVYFMQHGKNGLVKIGMSSDPIRRLKQLQGNTPKKLYVRYIIRNGGHRLERTLHTYFDFYNHSNEWFENDVLNLFEKEVVNEGERWFRNKLDLED